jgi:hypothetical protein
MSKEEINHPDHYNQGNIEVIDVIEDWGWIEGFCLGNILKYIGRCNHKDNMIDDLKKARWYLDFYIKSLEGGEGSE